MQALHRVPWGQTKERARAWGKLGLDAQARRRLERGPDADTIYGLMLEARRGKVIRHGITYANTGAKEWAIVHSVEGRTDHVDLVIDGKVARTCALRPLLRAMARAKL